MALSTGCQRCGDCHYLSDDCGEWKMSCCQPSNTRSFVETIAGAAVAVAAVEEAFAAAAVVVYGDCGLSSSSC